MKKIINLAGICLAFIILINTSQAIAEGGENDSPNKEVTADWVQYSKVVNRSVKDYVNVGIEGHTSELGYNLEFTFDFRWVWVKCCGTSHEKYSWCDRALTDKRC